MRHETLRMPLRLTSPTGVGDLLHRKPRARQEPSRLTVHSRAHIALAAETVPTAPPSHPFSPASIVRGVTRALLTLTLVTLALASAGAVAFGTHPGIMQYRGGFEMILLCRRLQWPLATLCLIACIVLIGLVISGKRRAWWLIALAPVLFLFYQRFAGDPFRRLSIVENPPFVGVEKAQQMKDATPVVGVVFEGHAYAYPCGSLARVPVLIQADADKRLMLMYSPYAGRAQAFTIEHSIKARELDIVSMPANAMLIYNARIGQFINAFTGLTTQGSKPEGFISPVRTTRTTWKQWLADHPETRLLATASSPASEKVQPRFPFGRLDLPVSADTRVTLLATTRPVALKPFKLPAGAEPINLTAGGANLLLFRDKPTDRLYVFDRVVKGDLFPKFSRTTVPKKPEVALVDSDTNSLWTADGRCVDGFAKGERLHAIAFEEDLPLGTLKTFYPDLELFELPKPQAARSVPVTSGSETPSPARRTTRPAPRTTQMPRTR